MPKCAAVIAAAAMVALHFASAIDAAAALLGNLARASWLCYCVVYATATATTLLLLLLLLPMK